MKNGLDWMPLDVHPDFKWELIESEYGLTGFGALVKLMQRIYAENGYYLEWSEDAVLLFSRKIGLDRDTVSKIVASSVSRGIFDSDLYERFHILTSAEIQTQFFSAARRRREIHYERQYLLVDAGLYIRNTSKAEIVGNNEENVCIPAENADISEQSKAKESRVTERRAEESSETQSCTAQKREAQFCAEEIPSSPQTAEADASPAPTKESLSAEYGEAVVNAYLTKAAGYRYRGANAVRKAAEWLAADVYSGKLENPRKRPPSFDLEDYDTAVKARTPVYARGKSPPG